MNIEFYGGPEDGQWRDINPPLPLDFYIPLQTTPQYSLTEGGAADLPASMAFRTGRYLLTKVAVYDGIEHPSRFKHFRLRYDWQGEQQ